MRKERTKRTKQQIKEKGLDAVLLFKAENIRYMTGYRPLWWSQSFLTRNAALMTIDSDQFFFLPVDVSNDASNALLIILTIRNNIKN